MTVPQSARALLTAPTGRLIGVLALCAAVLVIYGDTTINLVSRWALASNHHAPFVPLLSLFLLWRDRDLFDQPMTGSGFGVAALLVSVALWIVARATFVQAGEQIALFLMVNALVWAVAGNQMYKRLAIPLGFLAFAVPVGGEIVPLLMVITADISSAGLQMFNVPVYREAMIMTLPGGQFEVADVCSGIRYLNAGLMIAAVAALFFFKSWPRRIIYVSLAAVVFIVTNGLRAFLVMFVASATEMEHLAGADHIWFGWIMFLIAMFGMLWVAEHYSDAN